MREKRRVEIDTVVAVFFREIHPRLKVFVRIGVAIHLSLILAEYGVTRMKVQAFLPGHQRKRFFYILFELLEAHGFSGIIPRRLNPAFQRIAPVETEHVVALPAVYADRNIFQSFQRAFRIHAVCGIRFFCLFVSSHVAFLLVFILRGL